MREMNEERREFMEQKLFELWLGFHKDYQILPREYLKAQEEVRSRRIKIAREINSIAPKEIKFPRMKLLEISHIKEARKYIAGLEYHQIDRMIGRITKMMQSREYINAKALYGYYKDAIERQNIREQKRRERQKT